jgi:hypothetical protein
LQISFIAIATRVIKMRIIMFIGRNTFRIEVYNGNGICDNCITNKANFVLKQTGAMERYLCSYCFKTLKQEIMNKLFDFIKDYIDKNA